MNVLIEGLNGPFEKVSAKLHLNKNKMHNVTEKVSAKLHLNKNTVQ